MEVIADLHLHSHYSIATGRQADLEHLDLWGRYKGLQVVGTGDCTHPEWLREMSAKLKPVAAGTYELKPEWSLSLNFQDPAWEAAPPVRFVVTGEVSTIYKKGGRVRKVHLLLVLPGLEAAAKLSQRLGRLGNVKSDGRPILGLDAKQILELTLEMAPEALVIPAHIWTPWFSVLGSKSGFESLEECFEDLLGHIYALETGLSSDPGMNWRVSALDRFLLVSNSDAHSPQKLAREANIFTVPPTYADLARAVRTQEGFAGTIEFFPQEGKYHLDGHRHCGVRLAPEEAEAAGGVCPSCGKLLTYGVMHRVLDLADRPVGERSPRGKPFASLIPLTEVLAEVLEVNAGSKKVGQRYFRLLEKLGPELEILRHLPLTDLAREGGPLLAHGIEKMRRGQVQIKGGYDGDYGEIHLFTPEERRRWQGQTAFFGPQSAEDGGQESLSAKKPVPAKSCQAGAGEALVSENCQPPTEKPFSADPLLASLNPAQRRAVTHQGPPLIVQAGPGTGKTRALTHRVAYLLSRRGARPEEILALTFTRQAAGEMETRIKALLPAFPGLARLTVKTFHALGQQILLAQGPQQREVADEERRRALLKEVARKHRLPWAPLERVITRWKQGLKYPEELRAAGEPQFLPPFQDRGGSGGRNAPAAAEACQYLEAFQAYEATLERQGWWDYEDLIARPALLLAREAGLREAYRRRYRHLLVDEYQDLNEGQYRLFLTLAGPQAEIMVIGDPDQAIYGFRGASPQYFARFRQDWPQAVTLSFAETYRLPPPVLRAAGQARVAAGAQPPQLATHQGGDRPVIVLEAASEGAEARAIAREIEKLVGGLSHAALEDDHLRHQEQEERAGFKDVAVFYRVHALGPELARRLAEAGIPVQLAREGVGPDWDDLDLAAERVKLLSLHAAKGLEFPYVFIAGCEAGLIPWEPEGEVPADLAEEARLFYVGLTRASRQVFLTRARMRTLWGKRRPTQASPWVQALPPELLRRVEASPTGVGRQGSQPGLFPEIKAPRSRRSR
jgi:DNA helicase II / ATP-dependent DNA helicase PcrA